MGHRSDRREFIKMIGGAVVTPCMLRAADAMASGISSPLWTPRDQMVLADNPVPNQPIGVAKGLHPGRVVWAHDPSATDWAGPGQGHWWEGNHTNQAVVESMMSRVICQLGGKTNDRAAWHALIQHFNQTHGNGKVGYKKGEKVTIKVNLVGCIIGGAVDPKSYDMVRWLDYMNASPQMILALLRQLVHVVGVSPQDISVGDPLSLFPNQFYDPFHSEFPTVRYLDHVGGNASHLRTRVQYSSIPFYWSSRPKGTTQDYAPVPYVEAKYLINMANLKSHTGAGVTLCGKNHYGSLNRKPPDQGYYDIACQPAAGSRGQRPLQGRRGPDGTRSHRRQDPALFNRQSLPRSASHRIYSPQVVQPSFQRAMGFEPSCLPGPRRYRFRGPRFPPGRMERLPAQVGSRRLPARSGSGRQSALGYVLRFEPRDQYHPPGQPRGSRALE
jgi:hypothetical protein